MYTNNHIVEWSTSPYAIRWLRVPTGGWAMIDIERLHGDGWV